MKKIIITFIATLLAGVNTAWAQDSYNVWVGGTQITSAIASDVFGDGTVSYDGTTNTLTLNSYTYSGAGYENSAIYATGDLNIVVTGTNSLTSTAADGFGIYTGGSLTVTGSGSDPTLNVTAATGYAIKAAGSSASFDGITMALAGNRGIVVDEDNTSDTVSIENCTITFANGTKRAIQVYNDTGDASVIISSSSLTGAGEILAYGYGTSGGDATLTIDNSTIDITGNTETSRHGIELLSNYGDAILTIRNHSNVTVKTSNGSDAINVGSQHELNGKGKCAVDISDSDVNLDGARCGLTAFSWCNTGNVQGTTVSIANSTATIIGGQYYGLYAYSYESGNAAITITGSTVSASAPYMGVEMAIDTRYYDIHGSLSYTQTNSDVTLSGGYYGLDVDSSSKTPVEGDGNATVTITGGKLTSNGGLYVTGDTDGTVTMEGVTATIDVSNAGVAPIATDNLIITSGAYSIIGSDGTDIYGEGITGGLFTVDVSDKCADGYFCVTNTDAETSATYPYVVVEGVASITVGETTTKYETLAAAIAAAQDGETITLLKNCSGGGLFIGPNKFSSTGLTIDFGGYTYTVNTPVGSPNTVNQALHFEQGNKITLKNGAIEMTDKATELAAFEMFMQNYGTLIIDGMTIDGTGIAVATYAASYGATWGGTTKPQFNYNTAGSSVIRNSTITMTGDLGIDDNAGLTIEDDAVINVNAIATKGTDARYASATPTITVESGAQFTLGDADKAAAFNQLLAANGQTLGTADENGVYTVRNGSFVASVTVSGTTTKYETLADAIAAVPTTGAATTVKLLDIITLTDNVVVGGTYAGTNNATPTTTTAITNQNVTLDLNGKSITGEKTLYLAGGTLNITGTGTIVSTSAAVAPVGVRYVKTSAYSSLDYTSKRTLTIGQNVTLTGAQYGLNVFGTNEGTVANTIDVTVDGTVNGILFVLGNLTNANNNINIVVNGSVDASNAETGSKPKTGIALNGNATLTIGTGATVTGDTGIEVRAGNLTVNGGTITANASEYSYSATGSGTTIKGAAVAVAKHNTPCTINVNLNGGTLTGVEKVAVYDVIENNLSGVTVKASADYVTGNAATVLPDGFCWTPNNDNDNTYSPALGKVKIAKTVGQETTYTYYPSLEAAVAAVANGQTITLLEDVTMSGNATSPLTDGQSFLLDLGTYSVTNGDYRVKLAKGVMAKTSTAAAIFAIKDDVTDAQIVYGPAHAQTGHYAYYAATTTKQVAYINHLGNATTTASDDPVVVIDERMDAMLTLEYDGWFVVNSDVALVNMTRIGTGTNVNTVCNFILADGKTLTLGNGTGGSFGGTNSRYTFYGQTNQTGKLELGRPLSVRNLTQNGGKIGFANLINVWISATVLIRNGEMNLVSSHHGSEPILGNSTLLEIDGGKVIVYATGGGIAMKAGDITIKGGQIEAIAEGTGGKGMVATNTTTTILGLSDDPDDYIIASSYDGVVKIADGQTLYDYDDNYKSYTGTLTDAQKTAIAGHKLVKRNFNIVRINAAGVEQGNYMTLAEVMADDGFASGDTIRVLNKITVSAHLSCPLTEGYFVLEGFTSNANTNKIAHSSYMMRLHNGVTAITNQNWSSYTADAMYVNFFSNADANSAIVWVNKDGKHAFIATGKDDVDYIDANGATQTAQAIKITDGMGLNVRIESSNFYYAEGNTAIANSLYFGGGTANLILTDGSKLTTQQIVCRNGNGGVNSQNTLNIFGQANQNGILNLDNYGKAATLIRNINQYGGVVKSNSNIDVVNLKVTAGELDATLPTTRPFAAIGGITSEGTLTVTGGKVTAKSPSNTSNNQTPNGGIGLMFNKVNISGGEVIADGKRFAMNVGDGGITITGGKTTVKGGTYGMQTTGNVTMSLTKNDEYINSINGVYNVSGTISIPEGLYAQGTGDFYKGTVAAADINNKKLVLQPYEAVIDYGDPVGEVFYLTLAEADKYDQNGTYIIRLLHNIESPYTMGASPDSIMKINRNGRYLQIAAPRGYFVKAESEYNQTQVIDGQTVNDATITTYTSIPVNTTIATATYNAKPQQPDVDVTDIKNNVKLELDTDFKVVTVNTDGYTDAGDYVDAIRIQGIVTPEETQENGYIADIYSNFTILPLNLTDFVVSATAPYVATGYGADNSASGAAVKEAATITIVNGSGESLSDELLAVLDTLIDNDPTPANNYNNAGTYVGVVHVTPKVDNTDPNNVIDYSSNFTGSIAAGDLFIGNGIDITEIGMVESYVIFTGKNQPPSPGRLIVSVKDPVTGEKKRLVHNQDYVYSFNGPVSTYYDAKTYSHAVTITGIGEYYGSFTADYVISPRELTERYIVCEAVDPLVWTGGTLKLNVNSQIAGRTDNNVTLKLVNKEADPSNNVAEDAYYLTSTHDYTYTTEPVTMKDPGEYVVTFTGRYNFTGKRTVTVKVLKDIDLLAAEDIVIPVQVLGSVTPNIRPSNIQDMVVTDGGNALELFTHYTLTFQDVNGNVYQGGTAGHYITQEGKYTAIIEGKDPYYNGTKTKNFVVVKEFYDHADAELSADVTGIHITSGKNLTASVGAKTGAAIDTQSTSVSLISSIDVSVPTTANADTTVTFTINSIDDNAFDGCNKLRYIDATALTDYTPSTLSREFDGPFKGVPAQSLVYLKGTDVTGENYVYNVGTEYRCDVLKIYDDVSGAQTSFTETDGYSWAFENKYAFTAATLVNTRQLTYGKHYTTCLPYALSLPSTLKAYTYIGTGTSNQIVGFNEVTGTLQPYLPYVIIPSASGNLLSGIDVTVPVTPDGGTDDANLKRLTSDESTALVFYGTMRYMDGADAKDSYIMQGDKNWKKISGETSYNQPCILPMRAYIKNTSGGGVRELSTVFYDADNTTTLKEIELDGDDWTNCEVYDLQGRKVDTTIQLPKGVYIVNGVKRIRK